MRYPIYFLNKAGNEVATVTKELSCDGTPRYNDPKCPNNMYCLKTCLEDWKPVYKYMIGDIVKWKEYTLEVITVKLRDKLIRCKGVVGYAKTISWKHWLDFDDVSPIKLIGNE